MGTTLPTKLYSTIFNPITFAFTLKPTPIIAFAPKTASVLAFMYNKTDIKRFLIICISIQKTF